jgi:hypothetical protein
MGGCEKEFGSKVEQVNEIILQIEMALVYEDLTKEA